MNAAKPSDTEPARNILKNKASIVLEGCSHNMKRKFLLIICKGGGGGIGNRKKECVPARRAKGLRSIYVGIGEDLTFI